MSPKNSHMPGLFAIPQVSNHGLPGPTLPSSSPSILLVLSSFYFLFSPPLPHRFSILSRYCTLSLLLFLVVGLGSLLFLLCTYMTFFFLGANKHTETTKDTGSRREGREIASGGLWGF
ncbi:hypothetical protein J3E74DRAFT_383124, partial [Bipolaris maydis]